MDFFCDVIELDLKYRNFFLVKKVNKYFFDFYFLFFFVDDMILKRFLNIYVLLVEMDFLWDDSFLLVKRLNELGVSVIYCYWESMDYGFIGIMIFYKNV